MAYRVFTPFAAVIRAALDNHSSNKVAKSLFKDVEALVTDRIGWDKFLREVEKHRTVRQWPFYALGYASGVCFFPGLAIDIKGIVL